MASKLACSGRASSRVEWRVWEVESLRVSLGVAEFVALNKQVMRATNSATSLHCHDALRIRESLVSDGVNEENCCRCGVALDRVSYEDQVCVVCTDDPVGVWHNRIADLPTDLTPRELEDHGYVLCELSSQYGHSIAVWKYQHPESDLDRQACGCLPHEACILCDS